MLAREMGKRMVAMAMIALGVACHTDVTVTQDLGLPADQTVVADLTSDDQLAPPDADTTIDQATPNDETTPTDEATSIDQATPIDQTLPIDQMIPIDLTTLDQTPPPDQAIVSPPDNVTFLVGATTSLVTGGASPGGANGTLLLATFQNPVGIACAADSTLYVTEYDGNRVRKIASGMVSTLAAQANFEGPYALAFSTGGALIVQTDYDRHNVKSNTSGTLWNVALDTGFAKPLVEGLGRPRGLATRINDRIGVADRIREVVSVIDIDVLGWADIAGKDGNAGYVDAVGVDARFSSPSGIIELPDQSLLIADIDNHCLRQVALDGTVSTYSGAADTSATIDATRLAARYKSPRSLAVDSVGNVYVGDSEAHRIRRIVYATGAVVTVAGDGTGGYVEGPGASAEVYGIEGLAVSADGKILYFTDGNLGDGGPYHRIRQIQLP